MSAPKHEPVAGLTPEAANLVETYFSRVHGALLVAAAGECEETVDDLRAHVLEELEGSGGTATDVTRVLSELGSPEALAAECAAAVAGDRSALRERADGGFPLHGTVLGVPYELRAPTSERVVTRWWSPLDPHVIVPPVFGLGWTINFGALAVKLGIVNPDDEDVPFASVPPRYLVAALALPLLIAAALATLIALYQGGLPAQVPTHWGLTGAPDAYGAKGSTLFLPVAMTLVTLGIALVAWIRNEPPLIKVGAGSLATMLGMISVAAYAQEVATAHSAADTGFLLPGLALAFLLTFGLLVGLSRSGRTAEMRRDLKKKGS